MPIWLAYQLVLSAGRYRLACSFKARAPAPAAVQGWDRTFVIGTALAGFGWGTSELGYAVEELIGHPVTMVVHADDRAGLERHFADCLSRPGEVLRWEFRKIRKDGNLLWVRKQSVPSAIRKGGSTS